MSVYTSWDFNDLNDLGLELKVEPLPLFCLLSIITFWEHTRMILWNRPRAAPPPRRSRAPGGEHSAGEIQKNLIDRRQLATGSLQQRPAFTCVCVCKLLIRKQNRRWTSWYWHSCYNSGEGGWPKIFVFFLCNVPIFTQSPMKVGDLFLHKNRPHDSGPDPPLTPRRHVHWRHSATSRTRGHHERWNPTRCGTSWRSAAWKVFERTQFS